MIGPLGIDAFGLLDIVNALRDLADRSHAPRRLLTSTRYLEQRHDRNHSLITPTSTVEKDVSLSRTLLHRYPFLLTPPDSSALPHALTFIKLALRRDEFSDLSTRVHRFQNDELLDSLLRGQFKIQRHLQEANLRLELLPCRNVRGAQRLLECPHAELDGLPPSQLPVYVALQDIPKLHPTWNHYFVAPPLSFVEKTSALKFNIILAVVKALAAAHNVNWYHCRLSPENILIPSSSSPSTLPIKIIHFRCQYLGCLDGCTRCKSARHQSPLFLSPSSPVPPFYSAPNFPHDNRIDAYSLANLVLWLYSGCVVNESIPLLEQHNEYNISLVPWPLRVLILHRHTISMSTALLLLCGIENSHIDPHNLHNPINIPPSTLSSKSQPASTADFSYSDALRDAFLRSVVVGFDTEEPEAAIHLASHWEMEAHKLTFSPSSAADMLLLSQRCYDCYLAAAKLGCMHGALQVARLRAAHLDRPVMRILPSSSYADIMSLLLSAVLRGHRASYNVMLRIPKIGVLRSMSEVSPILTKRQSGIRERSNGMEAASFKHLPLLECDILNAIVRIGRCWRTGEAGLPRDDDQATAWLRIAVERSHAAGMLELGLHLVQTATCLEEAEQGIDVIMKVANNPSMKEADQACFRLGRWYLSGLPHAFSRPSINDHEGPLHDPSRGMAYIKKAVERKVPLAVVFFSQMYRIGLGGVEQSLEKANEWLFKGRHCAEFHYVLGMKKFNDAKNCYKRLRGEKEQAFPRVGSECSFEKNTVEETQRKWPWRMRTRTSDMLFGNDKLGKMQERQRLGYVDSKGQLTRAGAAHEFESGLGHLLGAGKEVKKYEPSELLNPFPYYVAGCNMVEHKDAWAWCSMTGQPMQAREIYQQGCLLLHKAAAMNENEEWHKCRVDFRQEDMLVVRSARSKISSIPNEYVSTA